MAYTDDCPFCGNKVVCEFWEDLERHIMKCREQKGWGKTWDGHGAISTCENTAGLGDPRPYYEPPPGG